MLQVRKARMTGFGGDSKNDMNWLPVITVLCSAAIFSVAFYLISRSLHLLADANRAMAHQVIRSNRVALFQGKIASQTLLNAIGAFNEELANVRQRRDQVAAIRDQGLFMEAVDPGSRIDREIRATMSALNCDEPTAIQWIINNVRNPVDEAEPAFVQRIREVIGELEPNEERSQ